MGNYLSSMIRFTLLPLIGRKQVRIVMMGLDAAGKTTMLYQLKLGEVVTTIPTIGFNVESVVYKNIEFMLWDIAGQGNLRALWRHYFPNTGGIIYVVDSADTGPTGRLDVARDELAHLLGEEALTGVPLIVMANKRDIPTAMNVTQVAHGLGLHNLHGRRWHVQGCSAISGDGLYEGLDWIATEMNR